ncbi:hypothetical protein INS49_000077 [Diaporthe citri]|uniref:uncharacterized protein n=1 Tax=Diaporthe citri TaxID=83186 RepID=UPI001C7EEB75|nr:uncharacterized protein INS49_000077 [Diaporthe citri]KAG6365901.1 hypothetical protein INS49_000077 [Diaporthe citri]
MIDREYLNDPEQDFLRHGIDDKPGSGPQTYGLVDRFLWATEMITSQRGIGWNWQVGGIPKPDISSRWPFIRNRLYKICTTFFLIHLVTIVANAILADDTGTSNGAWVALMRQPIFLRIFITSGWLTVVYGHVGLPENIAAVAANVWEYQGGLHVETLLGEILACYAETGEWLVRKDILPRRPAHRLSRIARRYSLLFLAFLVSGLIHASGSYMVTRDSAQGVSDGGALAYFLAQPAAICIEDMILASMGVSDDGRPSRLRRTIGYIYVAGFWLWCFPTLKVMPLAASHGLSDPRGKMRGAVRACKELSEASPFNPAKNIVDYILR